MTTLEQEVQQAIADYKAGIRRPAKPSDEMFRKVPIQRMFVILPCKLCGAGAELWQRRVRDDIWCSFVACTAIEDIDGEPCVFHLPDHEAFYHQRKKDAVAYWNQVMGPRSAATVGAKHE